jgi:hypothetical protein
MADTTVPTWPDGRPLTGSSLKAYLRFIKRLDELGATLVEPHYWLGNQTPHLVRCTEKHDCAPRPDSVARGNGVCCMCARKDPATAEAAFRDTVERLGGKVLGDYVNTSTPVRVRCAKGHNYTPIPSSVRSGRGICRICADRDPATAEAKFRDAVERLGGIVLGDYVNSKTPVLIRCPVGHHCNPTPTHISGGRGLCRVCAGRDPAAAEEAFRATVERLGGTVLGEYKGANTRVLVRCSQGHENAPRPGSVNFGTGICLVCAGRVSDVFYVVTGPGGLKFGVSSGDPRPRLSDHRRIGYGTVARLYEGLADTTARDLERELRNLLKAAGVSPVRGREYYSIEALNTVLYVVDDWLN